MRCEHLKDYHLGELDAAQARQMEAHLAACGACRDQLEELRLLEATLCAVRDEEPPRRIAFVSDKVFAPSWWERLWQSGPRLGFAGAGLLSVALLVHAFAPRPVAGSPTHGLNAAEVQALVDQQVAARVSAVVETAVARRTAVLQQALAESEARQTQRMQQIVHTEVTPVEKRLVFDQKALAASTEENFNYLQKQMQSLTRTVVASNDVGGGH